MKTNLFTSIKTDPTKIDISVSREDMGRLRQQHIQLLQQPCPMFLPCAGVFRSETDIILSFEKTADHRPLTQIEDLTQTEKLLLLLRIGEFFTSAPKRHYSTTFDPRNIVFTPTFDAVFLLRILSDAPIHRAYHEEFTEYRALVLSVLQDKLTFEQILRNGTQPINKLPLCAEIIEAQTREDLKKLLHDAYIETYTGAKKNLAFSPKAVKVTTFFFSLLLAVLTTAAGLFLYTNITRAHDNIKLHIYDAYHSRNVQAVVTYANRLQDPDMEPNLKRVVADALIATRDPNNLERAFYLDTTRQVEVIEILIDLQNTDIIAGLTSDNHLAQLYQAFYAKDHHRAISLVESVHDLKFDARAQILLARVYADLNQYDKVQRILRGLGDPDLMLESYKQQRDYVQANEKNPDLRRQLTNQLDDVIKLIEDMKRAGSA
ncbi:MAG: hypothetical protein FWF88_09330 [Peptococcaceae bacterium]|nr:hypothetical protein [Peptococcaceae bacterium]